MADQANPDELDQFLPSWLIELRQLVKERSGR